MLCTLDDSWQQVGNGSHLRTSGLTTKGKANQGTRKLTG